MTYQCNTGYPAWDGSSSCQGNSGRQRHHARSQQQNSFWSNPFSAFLGGLGFGGFGAGNYLPYADGNSASFGGDNNYGNYFSGSNSVDYSSFFGSGNDPFAGYNAGAQTPPDTDAQSQNPVNVALVEVGFNDNQADQHAQSVQQVFQQSNGQDNAYFVSTNGVDLPNHKDTHQLSTKADLDAFIDNESSDALNIMTGDINQIVEQGDTPVINGSLGYSRNNVYENVLLTLKDHPNLATAMGLRASDITSLQTNNQGQLLITDNVANAVVQYVDQRMDQSGSAYQQSLANYQDATQNAANHGVTVVVAAGNEHELNDVFNAHRLGGDTNFLAQSDNVISVAATDDKGTASTADDTVASFSSRGDGRYNPTVSAKGVGVSTSFGAQDGTSFAAPQVAALIAKMEEANPNLTFAQIKSILQGTATDIDPSSTLADGAGVVNSNLALQQAQQLRQSA